MDDGGSTTAELDRALRSLARPQGSAAQPENDLRRCAIHVEADVIFGRPFPERYLSSGDPMTYSVETQGATLDEEMCAWERASDEAFARFEADLEG